MNAEADDIARVLSRFAESCPLSLECDEGWHQIIADLDTLLAEACPDIRYLQIKEKFGGLRVYVIGGGPEAAALIRAAEERAYRTCETCGAPGRMHQRGNWYYTLCPEHAADGGYEVVDDA